MKRWKIASLIAVGVLIIYAALVAFVLPRIVKSQAVQRVEATGRKLAIGGISINPFTWTIQLRDLRLSEREGDEDFAAFSSARIAVRPLSLCRRAPVIVSARITSPHLRIVRVGTNAYNFSDLLKWLPKHPRLSVNNLTISNGSLDFIDRGLDVEKRHELRNVDLTVPFVSSMAIHADRYITPRLSALVNGSPFHLEAKFRPLRAVEAFLSMEFKDLALPYYLDYLPRELPVRMQSGRASAKVSVSYRAAQLKNPELALSGSVTLTDLKVDDRSGNPFFALKRLDAGIARARFLARKFDLSSLSADGLELYLSRDKKGAWSHSRLAATVSPGALQRGKALVSVRETQLRNGQLHFTDGLPPGGFRTDLEGVTLDMRDCSTSPGKRAGYTLFFATKRGEKVSMKGEFSASPLSNSSSFEVAGAKVESYYPYLVSFQRGKLKGRFDGSGHLDFADTEGVRLEKVSLKARQLSTSFGQGERMTLASLSLAGGKFIQKERLLEVGELTLMDGDLHFYRDRDGVHQPVTRLFQGGEGGSLDEERAPLRYRIGPILGSGIDAVFTDETRAARPKFAFKNIAFSLEKLTGPPRGPISFRVAAAYGRGSSLRALGSVTPPPWNLKGTLDARGIPLNDLYAYFPENLKMTVADGRVDARLAVSLLSVGGRLGGRFSGSAGIRSLHCLDAEGEELLKWESLQLDNMDVSLVPFSLAVGDVALNRFYSRIVIEKDGSLNLKRLYTRKEEGREQGKAETGKAEKVRIGAVTMQEGTLAFTDRHVTGGYTTTLFDLGGRISGLSSEENRFADVDLRGTLENRSPLRITGRINPLRYDIFADLKVSFTDISLSPMTPYSGTYLGYAVDKGQLFLDSKYRIENGTLAANNKILINQFEFGRRIESDKATNLPVRLAVALLKDRKGEIRLDLPVTGRTDDPQFSLWRTALQVLKNLVLRAAKSPFALLRAILGGKEELSGVGFAPGSAALSSGEREKLLKLAAALNDRPALSLRVVGYVDREGDDEGYRNELLLKKLRAEKFLDLVKKKRNQPGDSPETQQITPGEYAKYLKAVYAKEQFPKPRNVFGQIKSLAVAEMKKLILANTVVSEQQLRRLAEARAAGVRSFLVEQGKMDPARVSVKSGEVFRAPGKEGEGGSRVEFEVTAE